MGKFKSTDDVEHSVALRCFSQVLVASRGDENVVFDSNAAHRHVTMQNLLIDKA